MERIFSKSTLRAFWEVHIESEQYLKTWYETVKNADWKSPNDVKLTYANASILKNSRIVFNIKGNHYRLVVRGNYSFQMVWIRFIGTHRQYDKIDATKI